MNLGVSQKPRFNGWLFYKYTILMLRLLPKLCSHMAPIEPCQPGIK